MQAEEEEEGVRVEEGEVGAGGGQFGEEGFVPGRGFEDGAEEVELRGIALNASAA